VWEEQKSHFDTNHLHTIIWDENNLKKAGEELIASIRATLRDEAKQDDWWQWQCSAPSDARWSERRSARLALASVLRKSRPACAWTSTWSIPKPQLYSRTLAKMGLEGIVSKRLGSRYRSGRSPDWLKFKNPEAPAVKREAEEDWGRWWKIRRHFKHNISWSTKRDTCWSTSAELKITCWPPNSMKLRWSAGPRLGFN
jgi:hypothetical protein